MDTELETLAKPGAFREPSCEFVGWNRNDLSNHVPYFRLDWPGHPLHNSLIDANTVLRLDLSIPFVDRCEL